MNRNFPLVHALGLEIPSVRLLDRLGDRVLQQMPPLEPNGTNGANARNPALRGYGVNGPAVNGPAIEDEVDQTGGSQDINQPKNGNNEFQDVGEDAKATKGQDMEKLP